MEREIILTQDGTKTLFIKGWGEHYHSCHGALKEARHVFIKNGLAKVKTPEINILELGFGTGLNLLVTLEEFLSRNSPKKINYFAIEKYPVTQTEISILAYTHHFSFPKKEELYKKIHRESWEQDMELLPGFRFSKFRRDFFDLYSLELPKMHLVYFDCFGPRVQPDLWEKRLFSVVREKMEDKGILTTYSSKGSVRRILAELGFYVEKLVGPPGKREMINAIKNGKIQ
ncbi:MAG: peptidase [Bergeyella sp.]|nr:peptidase [Bergeyella sp.]